MLTVLALTHPPSVALLRNFPIKTMPLSRTQQAIAKMVSNNVRHKWQDYSSDDRSSARSFILSRASKSAYKEKKELFLTLANALQDDIWKVL